MYFCEKFTSLNGLRVKGSLTDLLKPFLVRLPASREVIGEGRLTLLDSAVAGKIMALGSISIVGVLGLTTAVVVAGV